MGVTSTLLEDVLEAARRGESLIAVGSDKRPWYSWKRYQDQAADEAQLLAWSRDRRTTAYAVVCGAVSGLVVLDFDEQGVELITEYGLEPHVRTGRGFFHLRLRHPGFYVATQNSKVTKLIAARWPGVDIRADGGYAIEFGHSEHGTYQQLRDLSELEEISILPEDMAAALGLLGADVLEELAGESSSNGKAHSSADGKFHTGHRHRHLLEIAGAMAGRGHTEEEILAELRRVNQHDCSPPKDDDQIVELARDVARRYGASPPKDEAAELDAARRRLADIGRLTQHSIRIKSVQVYGSGSSAEVEIVLSNGAVLQAERFADIWTHTGLARFFTQGTGIDAGGITKAEASEANAIIRRLAGYADRSTTARDLGTDHGVDFLDRAEVEAVNVNDQAQRYRAWSKLKALDPVRLSDPRLGNWRDPNRTIPPTVADASLVLKHVDGRRLVRCDWLYAHVHKAGEVAGPQELVKRMEHAGWSRRGRRGAIKATSPGMGPPIILPFWIVPAAWEDSL